ncbi:MAG TPA: TldD/PmbA family protein [Chloroflexia bacterium]|nr:TldD/PmbA family protein [Chloroflexia bacterium]
MSEQIMGREKVLQLLQDVLGYATADQTEITFNGYRNSLTRFANNYIHQNVNETNTSIKVRSIFGKKIGTATGNSLELEHLKQTVAMAEQLAHLQVDDPEFVSLPGPSGEPIEYPEPDEATYYSDPMLRAAGAGAICRRAQEAGFTGAGAFETSGYEVAVVNSLGVASYYRGASAHLSTVVMGENSSGWAERLSPRIGDIDFEAVAEEAVGRAERSKNPVALEPGEYEVILEEYAVAEMLNYMSYLGMGALSVQEERSFMKLGQQIMNPLITIYDDGHDRRGIISPFDAEGVRRQHVDLIVKGVANAVVYDSYTANREPGKENTGHSIGSQGDPGPIPLNLFIAPGAATKEQMLKNIKRGLWVTRFNYVNPLVPDRAVLTGTTRDGTFLIENGEIVGPVKNFRFTQSAVDALNDALEVGSQQMLLPSFAGGSMVPALHCKRFTFNSATQF